MFKFYCLFFCLFFSNFLLANPLNEQNEKMSKVYFQAFIDHAKYLKKYDYKRDANYFNLISASQFFKQLYNNPNYIEKEQFFSALDVFTDPIMIERSILIVAFIFKHLDDTSRYDYITKSIDNGTLYLLVFHANKYADHQYENESSLFIKSIFYSLIKNIKTKKDLNFLLELFLKFPNCISFLEDINIDFFINELESHDYWLNENEYSKFIEILFKSLFSNNQSFSNHDLLKKIVLEYPRYRKFLDSEKYELILKDHFNKSIIYKRPADLNFVKLCLKRLSIEERKGFKYFFIVNSIDKVGELKHKNDELFPNMQRNPSSKIKYRDAPLIPNIDRVLSLMNEKSES